MSMMKEHIDNKVEELAKALDMPFDTMMDWFIIKVVNSKEDLGRTIKDLAKCYNRTYDDVFDYVLLCMALMPDRDPVQTVFEFFKESTLENIRVAQNELGYELIHGRRMQ